MPEKIRLNDRFLTSISGGYLPENWEKEMDMQIAAYKSLSDEQMKLVGYSQDAEGLIACLAAVTIEDERFDTTSEEFQRLADYIRSHY